MTNSGSHSQKVLRAAGLMGVATLVSRILGLIREQVFAYFFGAGNLTDAFNVAFRIPSLLRNLFAEGAMNSALIPTFTQVRSEQGEAQAWKLAGLVFRRLFVIVGLIAILGVIFAPQLVSLYASAFKQIPNKYELTVRMTRIMFPLFPLIALAAAFMGVLNASEIFFLPALAPALFNLTSVVAGLFFSFFVFQKNPSWGFLPIEGMAVGVVIGGCAQAFCQLPALYRAGYSPKSVEQKNQATPFFSMQDPALRRILFLIAPSFVGLAATQASILVNTILATSQGPGAISWLSYSYRILQFPLGLFGVSIASATLPWISKSWVDRDFETVRGTLMTSLRHIFAINLPASVGLFVLGPPIIALIFQYGRFTSDDTRATALALGMYAIGLTAFSVIKLLVPACYAMGNARTPVVATGIAVAISITTNLLLVRPLGYWGLALGTSIAAIVQSVILLVIVRKMLKERGAEPSWMSILRPFFTQLGIALAMGALCWISYQGLNGLISESDWILDHGRGAVAVLRMIKVGLVVFEGFISILLLGKLLGVTDTTEALDFFTKKMKKKLSPKTT